MNSTDLRELWFDSTVTLIQLINDQYSLIDHLRNYATPNDKAADAFMVGYLAGLNLSMCAIKHHEEYIETVFDEFGISMDGGVENVSVNQGGAVDD